MRIRAVVTGQGLQAIRRMQQDADPRGVILPKLNDAADQVFSVSQRYVPVDTGYLKGSGDVDHATMKTMAATVSYSADYALAVHETHASKSGYLVRAVDTVWNNLPKDVADAIKQAWR